MRRQWIPATVAAVALAVAAPATQAPAKSPAPPVAKTACTYATIGGQSKCIARGQYCARRYKRQYRRYGLSCTKRDRRGRWHLQ
jgi:uncharacterized membrane protein